MPLERDERCPAPSLVQGTVELFMMPGLGGKAEAYWRINQSEASMGGGKEQFKATF